VRHRTLLRIALLALTVMAAAPAADVRIDDLRLEYSPLLGRNWRQYGQLDDQTSDGSVDIHANNDQTQTVKSHRRYGLGFYHSLSPLEAAHGAFVLGLAGGYDRLETLGGSYQRSLVLDGFVGFAWAFTPAWHLEEGLLLGGGRTTWSAHFHQWYFDNADWYDEEHAWMYEYGLRLGTAYTFAQHLQAGIDARYMVSSFRSTMRGEHTNGSTSESVSYYTRTRTEGLGTMVTLGWRF
jgi:hypothetical protein